jgi:hypothetical protein
MRNAFRIFGKQQVILNMPRNPAKLLAVPGEKMLMGKYCFSPHQSLADFEFVLQG